MFAGIADILLKAGEFDQALTAIEMISYEDRQASVLTSALGAMSETSEPRRAIPLLSKALAVKRRTSRLAVLQLLQAAGPVIAKIDKRTMLWRFWEALTEIDRELGSSRS